MIEKIRNLSIHRKLLLTVLFPSLSSLIVAGLLLSVLEIAEFQQKAQNDLTTLASLIGNRSIAAVIFQDVALANENLATLNMVPTVQAACLYDAKGSVFAQLLKSETGSWRCPLSAVNEKTRFEDSHLCVVMPIVDKQENLGTILIHADFTEAYWHKIQFTGLLFLVLAGISLMSFFLSAPLIMLISRPIKKLVYTVKTISETKDYSLRAEKMHADEMGVLVDAFNDLIMTVDIQNQALTRAKDRYMALYNDNPTMVFNLTEDGLILSANLTGAYHLGLSIEDLQNRSIFDFIHPSDLSIAHGLIAQCLLNGCD
ncbi:MAG: CHASE sensor domain-containing protein [Methylovulum sp.]|nr:CHASE sensor domain-containing protein [Methylovulum sp.]